MAADSKPGTNKLASVMTARMRKENTSPPAVEFGEIQGNKSLVTDSFPISVPKGEYMVLSHVSADKLSSGDRVLVVWIQNEAVVIDVVENS